MPSEAAKKDSTDFKKNRSLSDNFSQSFGSWDKSNSSAVQKEASAFLYICQISLCWIGNKTNRFGFSLRIGSMKACYTTSCFSSSLASIAAVTELGDREGEGGMALVGAMLCGI